MDVIFVTDGKKAHLADIETRQPIAGVMSFDLFLATGFDVTAGKTLHLFGGKAVIDCKEVDVTVKEVVYNGGQSWMTEQELIDPYQRWAEYDC